MQPSPTYTPKFATNSIVRYKNFKLKVKSAQFNFTYNTFIYTCEALHNGLSGQYSQSLLRPASPNITDFLSEKELERLAFIKGEYQTDTLETIKQALSFWYKETLSRVNHGNEHDGKPLINEI